MARLPVKQVSASHQEVADLYTHWQVEFGSVLEWGEGSVPTARGYADDDPIFFEISEVRPCGSRRGA
jgi:hypothetical protein